MIQKPPTKFEVSIGDNFGFSIFGLLTSNLVRFIARRLSNLLINFGVSGTFRSRLMGQHLSDGPRDLATLTLTLEVMAPEKSGKILVACAM